MPRKATGEHVTSIVHQKRANGDIYVIEREQCYDPKLGYTKCCSQKLLGKIIKGQTEMVPTRPKAKSKKKAAIQEADADKQHPDSKEQDGLSQNQMNNVQTAGPISSRIAAAKEHIHLMDIMEFIGKASGVDQAVYDATEDIGTAQKIISIARYIVCTDGRTMPEICEWQLTHPLPYTEGISENVYHDLFKKIGHDEGIKQRYFDACACSLNSPACLAYDSTTISTYSNNIVLSRYGHNDNDDGEGLKQIKYMLLYSVENRQPIAYSELPGNVPDVDSIEIALGQISFFDIHSVELFCDNGFYSAQNVAEMILKQYHFIMRVKNNVTWVKSEINKSRTELSSITTACPFDPSIHGTTVTVQQSFAYDHLVDGERVTDSVSANVYLHIFFSRSDYCQDQTDFESEIYEIKKMLEDYKIFNRLPKEKQDKASRYLIYEEDSNGSIISVKFNTETCAERQSFHGYFVLLSDDESDTFKALKKYRSREVVEEYFKVEKHHADGERPRDWTEETWDGRMFAQFVSLGYREYLSNRIREIKKELEKSICDNSSSRDEIDLEKKLLSWMKKRSLHRQLMWFDAIETTEASKGAAKTRWSAESLKQDALYLHKLGMLPNPLSYGKFS